MNIFKKNGTKRKQQKLPMTGKVQKGFRAYCAVQCNTCFRLTDRFCRQRPDYRSQQSVRFYLRSYPCYRYYHAWLRYRSGRSFSEISRPVSESQRFPDPCRRYHHHLCKGNPYPYYRLRKNTVIKRGIPGISGMPLILKEVQTDE